MRRRAAALACTLVATIGVAAPAAAARTCVLVGDELICEDEAVAPAPKEPRQPPASSPFVYDYERGIGPCPGDEVLWLITVRFRSTGEVVRTFFECIGPGEPPTPTPPPPTATQFARAIEPLLELDTGLSPPANGVGGVSQLPTWFWCSPNGTVDIDLPLGGWRTTANAAVTQLVWTIEGPDGTIVRRAEGCGSEPAPGSDGSAAAATWTPNESGSYTITLEATWGGTWTRSYGVASQTFPLDSVPMAYPPVVYPVVEIQTVGTG